jgi:hypothetical protein
MFEAATRTVPFEHLMRGGGAAGRGRRGGAARAGGAGAGPGAAEAEAEAEAEAGPGGLPAAGLFAIILAVAIQARVERLAGLAGCARRVKAAW